MIKYYISFVLIFLCCFVNAQIKKGSVLLGGQISYLNDKHRTGNYDQKTKAGTFSLSLGKAYKENRVFGASISFSPSKQYNNFNGTDSSNRITNSYSFGLFYRQYKSIAKDLYFFTELNGAFTTSNQTDELNFASREIKSVQRGASLSFTPGISYQIFKKVQFEVIVPNLLFMQYSTTKTLGQPSPNNTITQKRFDFYSTLTTNSIFYSFGTGFRIIL